MLRWREVFMKNIVITGSTRGIGLAMAKAFLKAGCNVTLSGRGDRLSPDVEKELQAYEGNYQYVSCDVQKRSDHEALWAAAVKKFGAVDIWINNAGQNAPHDWIQNTQECYVCAVVNTNITGMILGSQVAALGLSLIHISEPTRPY
jgi:NAD(P)-dependent dehydrogenase (short-subunit alcohol dehydrogenase family)